MLCGYSAAAGSIGDGTDTPPSSSSSVVLRANERTNRGSGEGAKFLIGRAKEVLILIFNEVVGGVVKEQVILTK